VLATPSLPAAQAFLAAHGALRLERYTGTRSVRRGYEIYFTLVMRGERTAVRVKVCEDPRGHVTGSSNISNGESSC
jgi:hypothetical protein